MGKFLWGIWGKAKINTGWRVTIKGKSDGESEVSPVKKWLLAPLFVLPLLAAWFIPKFLVGRVPTAQVVSPQTGTYHTYLNFSGGVEYLNTQEISRFGQMLLNGGAYEGRQLVPADYLKMATSKQIDNAGTPDWSCGYGFQFWMCVPEHVYRGDGANGQYCIVCPDQDATIAITSHEEKNLQGILDCVWQEILPQL